MLWWDPTPTGPDELRREGTGMWRTPTAACATCRASGPSEDRLFVQDGGVAIYTERPPGEEPGEYPSPAGG